MSCNSTEASGISSKTTCLQMQARTGTCWHACQCAKQVPLSLPVHSIRELSVTGSNVQHVQQRRACTAHDWHRLQQCLCPADSTQFCTNVCRGMLFAANPWNRLAGSSPSKPKSHNFAAVVVLGKAKPLCGEKQSTWLSGWTITPTEASFKACLSDEADCWLRHNVNTSMI